MEILYAWMVCDELKWVRPDSWKGINFKGWYD